MLLDHGANMEAADAKGRTALLLAAEKGHNEIIQILLGANANIEAIDKDGRTPLMLAMWHRKELVVGTLLAYKAEIGARDYRGRTARVCEIRDDLSEASGIGFEHIRYRHAFMRRLRGQYERPENSELDDDAVQYV